MDTDAVMSDKRAFVFPGQGSQKVGMLTDYLQESVVVSTFEEASEVLGFDLFALVNEGPVDSLNRTENTQPALLTTSVALWRLFCERGGIRPTIMAGHSLGEYSALVCAGALDFKEAVRLVHLRGQFMQNAVAPGEGTMAAIIGLDDNAVIDVCSTVAEGDVVEAVNFNAPGQVVIAGHKAAVKRAVDQAKQAGARKAIELPVSVPSHCLLMQPAAERLAAALENITLKPPAIPVVQNVTADVCSDPESLKQHLVAQLYRPVRWVDSVLTMQKSDIEMFVECGPGKVLAGLNKRIIRSVPVVSLESGASMNSLLAEGK